MRTKHLELKIDWIITDSLDIFWYSNGQLWYRHELKDGVWHGDCKGWYRDGRLSFHNVWENGEFIKTVL